MMYVVMELNLVLEHSKPVNSLRLFKNVLDNVLLEHGGLPHVLLLGVNLEAIILSQFYWCPKTL